MGQIALQIVGATLIAVFVLLAIYARTRLSPRYLPISVGFPYSLLYGYHYLNPARRVCPGCGFANVPTAVRCENPIDHSSKKDTLEVGGELVTRENIRLWGLRTLVVMMISAALVVEQPWAVFVVLVATALWMVVPMVTCHRTGRFTFLLVSIAIMAVTAIVHFAAGTEWQTQIVTVDPTMLSAVDVGFARFNLTAGTVTPAMVWLNFACALAAVVSVVVSIMGHRQNPHDRVYRPWTVFALGIALSALLLAAVSMLQQLTGFVSLYLLLAFVAFGWFLSASLMHAITAAFKKVKLLKTTFIRVRVIAVPPRPTPPPRPARRDLAGQLAYTLERILSSTSHAVAVVVIQTVNLISRAFTALVNLVLRTIEWVLLYIWAVLTTLMADLLISFPVLFRIASSGYRIALFAPALLVGAGFVLALSADESQYYLQSGNLLTMLVAVLAFAVAALAISIAASLYVTWSVVRSFLITLRDDYIPQAIIFFAVSLDAYGIWRLIIHVPSHFGIVSWALNGVIVLAGVYALFIRRARTAPGKTP
jgi:hypothetical protein